MFKTLIQTFTTDRSFSSIQAKNPSNASFEEKLAKYSKLAGEVWSQAADFDLDFVLVSARSLAGSVRDEALAWVKALRDVMRDIDLQTFQVFNSYPIVLSIFQNPCLMDSDCQIM